MVADICRRAGRHRAGDRARRRPRQRLWDCRHRLAAQQPLLAAVAGTAHGDPQAPDARVRRSPGATSCSRRSKAPSLRRLVGVRRPIHVGGRCSPLPFSAGHQTKPRRSRRSRTCSAKSLIATLTRGASAPLSPARHHPRLRRREARRAGGEDAAAARAHARIFPRLPARHRASNPRPHADRAAASFPMPTICQMSGPRWTWSFSDQRQPSDRRGSRGFGGAVFPRADTADGVLSLDDSRRLSLSIRIRSTAARR